MLDWIQLSSSLDSSSSKSIIIGGISLLIWAQVKGFVAENNTTFRLKDVKELVYGRFGRITKEVWGTTVSSVLML
jgi:hypothetical protein